MKLTVLAISLVLAGFSYGADHASPHWSYDAPEQWGKLSDQWATCSTGHTQSPIDLKWSRAKNDGKVEFAYQSAPLKIIDNGHTIQVNFDAGSKVNLRGHEYDLVQMHFHTSSEHTISGKGFPLELHLVHKNSEGRLAVVGVMFEVGTAHPALQTLWDHLPTVKNVDQTIAGVTVNPVDFLPPARTYYHYTGSLTTPPCSEGVNWNVLNTPVQISKDQLAKFTQIYAKNNRPIQPLNGRKPANF